MPDLNNIESQETYLTNESIITSWWPLDNHVTGIIVIAVVFCVVLTSVIWVIIIYETRRKDVEDYMATNSDETNFSGEVVTLDDVVIESEIIVPNSSEERFLSDDCLDKESIHLSEKDSGTGEDGGEDPHHDINE